MKSSQKNLLIFWGHNLLFQFYHEYQKAAAPLPKAVFSLQANFALVLSKPRLLRKQHLKPHLAFTLHVLVRIRTEDQLYPAEDLLYFVASLTFMSLTRLSDGGVYGNACVLFKCGASSEHFSRIWVWVFEITKTRICAVIVNYKFPSVLSRLGWEEPGGKTIW